MRTQNVWLYDLYKSKPDSQGVYLMLKWTDPDKPKPDHLKVGQVKPAKLTKREYNRAVKALWAEGERRKKVLEGELAQGKIPLLARPKPRAKSKTLAELIRPWAARRKNADASHERQRLEKHILPVLGHLRPKEITAGHLLDYIDDHLDEDQIGGPTIKKGLMLLSRWYNDARMKTPDLINPVSLLDKATRAKFKSDHDPRDTPFLEKRSDIGKIYRALPAHVRPAFAVGVFAGLRKNEIAGLEWRDVDIAPDQRKITVRRTKIPSRGATRLPKGRRIRVVPILDVLLPILKEWKLACPPSQDDLVFPSLRPNTGRVQGMVDDHTWPDYLRPIIADLGLSPLTWYQSTRHTFASHWVQDGGTLEALREILGHTSIVVTERYAHLRPNMFSQEDLGRVSIDLSEPEGEVVKLGKDATESVKESVKSWVGKGLTLKKAQ